MTAKQLIEKLSQCNPDSVVILTEPDGIGWDNIGIVIDTGINIKITMDGNTLFND